jgi:excisionase family DNA binding protein
VLTVVQVAERLAVGESTVRSYIRTGRLRAARVGPRLYRVTEADLGAFLASAARDASPAAPARPRPRPTLAPDWRAELQDLLRRRA